VTDLEELFRPLIDESAPYREPVETIEARVRDLRVRRRRQRAQYRFGAAFLAVALIVTAVGVVHARSGGAPARPSHVATTTTPPPPTVVAPAGWSTYDYGLARLSIPPGWTTAELCAPVGRHALLFEIPGETASCVHQFRDSVRIGPLQTTDCGACVPNASVNGIPYETVLIRCLGPQCPTTIYVPALGVSVSFAGDGDAILQTLTYSTYARLLQQPFGAVPASWKTVTFDGFSVRVPADWPTVDLTGTADSCYAAPNTVYVGSPQFTSCPPRASINGSISGLQSQGSLSVEPGSTRLSGPASSAPGPIEWHHNGLRFKQHEASAFAPLATVLYLDVDGPHGHLLLGLGLGRDPAVARGILGSLQPLA
jgi:hypothetical protein